MSSNIDWALATLDDRKALYETWRRMELWADWEKNPAAQKPEAQHITKTMLSLDLDYAEMLIGRIMLKRKDFES